MASASLCLFTFMVMISNTGFMGIPISKALYGDEGVFYAALIDSVFNIVIFTVGMLLIRKAADQGEGGVDLKVIITPGLISVGIGLLLFFCNFQFPSFLGETVASIGSATTPLAMFIVGFQLGKFRLRELLASRECYVLAAVRLVVLPLVLVVASHFLFAELSLFLKIVILECAMPAATCGVILVQKYGGDIRYMSRGVVMTTLFSIVTIPLMVIIMEAL